MSIIAISTINPAVAYILNTLSKVCTKQFSMVSAQLLLNLNLVRRIHEHYFCH